MFRKTVFTIVSLLPVFAFGLCDKCKTKDKLYVELNDLVFDSEGIWFKNRGTPVDEGTEALHVDSRGYYVSKNEQTWKCAKCGHVNPGTYPGGGCRRCTFPYDFR